MKIEKKVSYEVSGKTFETHDEAKEYLRELRRPLNYDYYEVLVEPNLDTEFEFTKAIIVAIENEVGSLHTLIQYLVDNYGDPISITTEGMPRKTYKFMGPESFHTFEDLVNYISIVRKAKRPLSPTVNEDAKIIYVDEYGKEDSTEIVTN